MVSVTSRPHHFAQRGFENGACHFASPVIRLVLEKHPFSCYIYPMAITQTVEIPADRRITLEVPHEVPTGPVVLTFSQTKGEKKPRMTEAEEKEWINDNIEWLNEEAMVNLSFQSWNPAEDEDR